MKENYQLLPLLKTNYNEAIANLEFEEDGFTSLEFESVSVNQKAILGLEYGKNPTMMAEIFTEFKKVIEANLSENAVAQLRFSETPRFLLLGEPGGGKSTFCKFLSFQCQNQLFETVDSDDETNFKLLAKDATPLIPVYVKLSEWEDWSDKHAEKSLETYLVRSLYESVDNAPNREQWKEYINDGKVLLLFDGLDEILDTKEFSEKIAETVSGADKCPFVITCRTFSFRNYKDTFSKYPVFSLGGLTVGQQDLIIKKYTTLADADLQRLRHELNNSAEIGVLAQNTLLLTIICFIVSGNPEFSLPKTRTRLYSEAVDKLLDKSIWQRFLSKTNLEIEEYKAVLSELAFQLWRSSEKRKIRFKGNDIRKMLDKILDSDDFKYLRSSVVDPANLLADFAKHGGILLGETKEYYGFLHLTFFEYLVANSLAKKENYLEIVEKHLDESSWNVVLMLLGGSLAAHGRDTDEYIDFLISKNIKADNRLLFKAVAAAVEADSPQIPDLTYRLYRLKVRHNRTGKTDLTLLDRTIRLVSKQMLPTVLTELKENRKNEANSIKDILRIIFSPYVADELKKFLSSIEKNQDFAEIQELLKSLLKKMGAYEQ